MITYQPGDIILDKYRIEKHLGQGAFGDVYIAFYQKLNTFRAIKVLRQDAPGVGSTEFSSARHRFELEAKLGAMHKHPNLIEVYEYDEIRSEGTLLLAMEYAAGGNLEDILKDYEEKNQRMAVEEVIRIANDIATGLANLHARDIVHRDLKPSNILFDGEGRARIADMGLAQVPGGMSERSYLGSMSPEHPGTPGYKSPEQEKTRDYLTPSSDIYTFGIILFRLLTGRMYRNVKLNTHPTSLREGIPNWLDKLVMWMLAKDPDKRPFNGQNVTDEIERNRKKHKCTIKLIDLRKHRRAALSVVGAIALVALGVWAFSGLSENETFRTVGTVIATRAALAPSKAVSQPTNTKIKPTSTNTVNSSSIRRMPTSPRTTRTTSMNTGRVMPGDKKFSGKDGMGQIFIGAKGSEPAFWFDRTAVSYRMFEKFVQATKYKTDAEKLNFAWVYHSIGEVPATQFGTNQVYEGYKWSMFEGANWKNTDEKDTGQPVTQVSWNDAAAYCEWAGRELSSESQWKAAEGIDEVQTYNVWYGLAEWIIETTASNRHKIISDQVIYVSQYPFPGSDRITDRSANILTFRCVESK